MSLILTSSQQSEFQNTQVGVENPYSFHNYFTSPLLVEPNSSIAVQSVKFNRDETWNIMDGNNFFGYLTIGEPYVNTTADLDDYQWKPVPFQIPPGVYTRGSLASAIRVGLNRALEQHVDIDTSETSVTLKFDANLNFDGFTFVFKQKAAPTSTIPATASYLTSMAGNTAIQTHAEILYTSPTMTAPGSVADPHSVRTPRSSAMFTEYPISHMDGTIIYNVSGARHDPTGAAADTPYFAVGLRRPCQTATNRASGASVIYNSGNMKETQMENYRRLTGDADGLNYLLKGCRGAFDYVVYVETDSNSADYNKIKVAALMTSSEAQSLMPGDAGTTRNQGHLTMCNIPYETMTGGYYSALIDWAANDNGDNSAGKVRKFKFTIKNELVKLEAWDGAWRIMLDYATDQSVALPNCGQNRWALYPKITMAQNHTGRAVLDAYIEIEEYNCRTDMPTDWYGGGLRNLLEGGCWYSNNIFLQGGLPKVDGWYGQKSKALYIDCQDYNNYTLYSTGDPVWTSKTTSGGNRLDDFNVGLISYYNRVQPPASLTIPTIQGGFLENPTPNCQDILGFHSAFTDDVFTAGATSTETLLSDKGDTPTATSSLFVRVNSTGQTSFNGATSTISKILYQIPQFNQTGASTGALYFEPGQRTYIKLGNPNQITMNDIRVDIVDRNEGYATELSGATIVMFHIVGPKDIIS